MGRVLACVLASVVVGGCGGARLPAESRRVRLASARAATEYSQRTERLEIPFELDRDGLSATALVFDLLRAAEASGAAYVSDVAIAVHFEHDGVPLECISTLELGERAPARAVPTPAVATPPPAEEDIYSTTMQPWRPEHVKAWVDDRELVCKKVAVATAVPRYTSRHDAAVGRYYAPGKLPAGTDTWIEYKDACHLETRHKFVERYAHFVATRIAPVEVARLEAQFADPDQRVIEGPPECHQIEPGQHPAHRVMGNLHYRGAYRRTGDPPDVLAH